MEKYTSERKRTEYIRLAKIALFDEVIDLHLDGLITFEEAIEQYQEDIAQLEG